MSGIIQHVLNEFLIMVVLLNFPVIQIIHLILHIPRLIHKRTQIQIPIRYPNLIQIDIILLMKISIKDQNHLMGEIVIIKMKNVLLKYFDLPQNMILIHLEKGIHFQIMDSIVTLIIISN